ncbi:putative hydrolase of the HAD superfamily [Propionicimonas paludicola]|uniref:Putative hydrolase of the HAD superfamily n=1 Tax=Propionicimonas paludicola TaxID=185243 RepID=A0A2A9CVG7_9ACTN|nr:HAD family phosphatase [Propionicimonas paludicola]PFG18417.1 putative hydrolase of the HAD superfamily [Propionicimonas paludicola]
MIRALLFDADGVLQWPTAGAIEAFTRLGEDRPGFVKDLLAEEATTMTGQVELVEVLQTVIERYRLTVSVEELIQIWYRIELREPMLEVVAEARAAGLKTALATNQQPYRGRWMQQNLPYADYFDELCYSFELGVAKPDPAYFTQIVTRLGVAPEEAVMIDDLPENIEAARSAGLHGIVHTPADDAVTIRRALGQLDVPGF